jgi:superoxide dismutase, Cu-Zn family
MRHALLALALPGFALAACQQEAAAPTEAPGSGQIEEAPAVPLGAADGKVLGEIAAGDSAEGAVLKLTAQGLPPGTHGVHIHDVGLCEAPSFESAGPHWNPENKEHGLQNPQGPHRGDLPNLTVGNDGRAEVTMTVQGSNLSGSRAYGFSNTILDENGAALVIHAGADDFKTDPSGNSGDRIACAVLGAPAASQ